MQTEGEQLCERCGFCCNGVLFHEVRLQAGDAPKSLTRHGLRVRRSDGGWRFHQPCPMHGVGGCRIYQDRPTRCRLFVCEQLRRVEAGESDFALATRKVEEAREEAIALTALLDTLGSTSARRPLTKRCEQALADPSIDEGMALELRRRWMNLETILEQEFRVKEAGPD